MPLDHTATCDDLVAQPDHVVAEILDGELYTSPRPSPRDARAGSRLTAIVLPAYDFGKGGPGGWTILAEPELHLRADVLVPDIAGWRRGRMPRLPDTAYFPLARTIEVFRLDHGRWTLVAVHAGDETVRAEPFEALDIDLTMLWGEPD